MDDSISNTISLILLLFCCGALVSIVLLKILRPNEKGHVQNVIYGFSLFACGLFSYLYTTRYAGLPAPILKRLDHAAIFLLIAGTYTPFASGLIKGMFRVRLIYWIWGVALTGVFLRLTIAIGYDKAFFALYLLAGWMFVTALPDIINSIPRKSLVFLGLGAAVYTCGAAVYAIDPGAWTVSVWHIFVLTAAVLHYVAVLSLSASRRKKLHSI